MSLFVNGYQPALVEKEARGKKMEAQERWKKPREADGSPE